MKRRLWHWWPLLPALAILYTGGVSFLDKYPHAANRNVALAKAESAPDSLLAIIQSSRNADTAAAQEWGENPFRPVHGPSPASGRPAGPKADPPWRGFVLKGTVGAEVATIMDRAGRKRILKVGDGVDSAVVVSIEPNTVVLKDRAGKFELQQEQ